MSTHTNSLHVAMFNEPKQVLGEAGIGDTERRRKKKVDVRGKQRAAMTTNQASKHN